MKFGIFAITVAFVASAHAFGSRNESYSCRMEKDGVSRSGSLELTANEDGSRGGSVVIAGLKVRVVKEDHRVDNRGKGLGGFFHDVDCASNPLNVFNRRCYKGTHTETSTELQVTSLKGNEARENLDLSVTHDENDDGSKVVVTGTYQANGQKLELLTVTCIQD